jgi:hypothetical protein
MIEQTRLDLAPKGSRGAIRILKSVPDGLLISSLVRDGTTILYCKFDSPTTFRSIVVISFKQNLDILNASLSPDNELVHVTERVTRGASDRMCYRSVVYDVQGIAKFSELFYSVPVDGTFIHNGKRTHLLLFTDNRLINFEISRSRKGIERTSRAIIANVIWMSYWNGSLTAVTGSRNQFALQTFEPNSTFSWTIKRATRIGIHPSAFLPLELSLSPQAGSWLPIFRYSLVNIFFVRCFDKLCIIQQLFDANASNLRFFLSISPGSFAEAIAVKRVRPDIPICVYHSGNLIVVFAPNTFVCVIDVRLPKPAILFLPKACAASHCGDCAESVRGTKFLVDLNNPDLYQTQISFKSPLLYLSAIDRPAISAFALVCVRLNDPEILVDILEILQLYRDPLDLAWFFREFFRVLLPSKFAPNSPSRKLPRVPDGYVRSLHDLSFELSESDGKSWTAFFRFHLSLRKRISKRSCDKCLVILREENDAIRLVRKGTERWIAQFHPSSFHRFAVNFVVESEAIRHECPAVPVLWRELAAPVEFALPMVLNHRLMACRLFQSGSDPEPFEMRYWRARLGSFDGSSSDELSITLPPPDM